MMKVRQLIEELSKMDPEADVYYDINDDLMSYDVDVDFIAYEETFDGQVAEPKRVRLS